MELDKRITEMPKIDTRNVQFDSCFNNNCEVNDKKIESELENGGAIDDNKNLPINDSDNVDKVKVNGDDAASAAAEAVVVSVVATSSERERFRKIFKRSLKNVIATEEFKELMDLLQRLCVNVVSKNPIKEVDPEGVENIADDHCIVFFKHYVEFVLKSSKSIIENIKARQFINFIKFCISFWNLTDKFESVCTRMVKFDVHVLLIRVFGKLTCSITEKLLLEKDPLLTLIWSLIGILHNIYNALHYVRSVYRKEEIVKYLMQLTSFGTNNNTTELTTTGLSDKNNSLKKKKFIKNLQNIKVAVLLLLSFIVNEDENSTLNATDDHLLCLIGILKECMQNDTLYSQYYGYHCLEILRGLRQIAAPDNIKRRLVVNGILSLIGNLFEMHNKDNNRYRDEVEAAMELLWTLSFCKECLLALDTDGCELTARIKELAEQERGLQRSTSGTFSGGVDKLLLAARGVLWNMESCLGICVGEHGSSSFNSLIRKDSEVSPRQAISGHLMISYNHSTQPIMIKVKEALVNNGYKVWMDVDHMRGSFVDAMAESIQHASLLVIGICQAFKNSPHCRQEVKYAYTLGIPLVPILLEANFVPDGWLGLMCATLIHTEFLIENDFDKSMSQLMRQIGDRGKAVSSQLSTDLTDAGSDSVKLRSVSNCEMKCCTSQDINPKSDHSSMEIGSSVFENNTNKDIPDSQLSFHTDHSFAIQNSWSQKQFISSNDQQQQFPYSLMPESQTVLFCNLPSHCFSEAKRHSFNNLIKCNSSNNLTKSSIGSWNQKDCVRWLQQKVGIQLFSDKEVSSSSSSNTIFGNKHSKNKSTGNFFKQLTGPLLLELVEMRQSSSDSFFTAMQLENVQLIDCLKLSRALREIDKLPE